MIEVLPDFPDGVVGLRCADHVTRADYETILIPALAAAFRQHETLRAYCEIPSLSGMSPGAMWDDVLVGLETLARWDRVAIVTDLEWIGMATTLFAFLIPSEVRVFPRAEAEKAREWIVAPDAPTS
jgi:hypothetical protein